tara:strand:- start:695 stop:928 length:234 start_codon:yes stop_codon:yes gene_type:complete
VETIAALEMERKITIIVKTVVLQVKVVLDPKIIRNVYKSATKTSIVGMTVSKQEIVIGVEKMEHVAEEVLLKIRDEV